MKDMDEPRYLRAGARDNVAIVANSGGLRAGARFPCGLELAEDVPEGHKVALADIAPGAPVIRYGASIGAATVLIRAGCRVGAEQVALPRPPALGSLEAPATPPPEAEPLEGYFFEGYRNPDGTAGTRNVLAVTTTVQCVAAVVEHAVERIRKEILPRYPNVDGVVALTHTYGCGVAIDAPGAGIPIRTVRHLAMNPNFGGAVMAVSLGCEKLQPARLSLPVLEPQEPFIVRLQDEEYRGFGDMVGAILEFAGKRIGRLNQRRRVRCAAGELRVGVQCGGSDAFSGVTANPAVGFAADLLVRAGAAVIFSEITEVRDAAHILARRAAGPEVAAELRRQMEWYDEYLRRGGVDRSANPTPGNRRGGLANVVEKALGSVVKSGSTPLKAVIGPGERAPAKGLVFLAGPASDFICGTLQLAAGMNVHVFTTGEGSPYGLGSCPVIKVASRTALARRWPDLIDFDAGRIASGGWSIEQAGWALFRLILEAASGRRTCAERLGLANALALFNPAPVT